MGGGNISTIVFVVVVHAFDTPFTKSTATQAPLGDMDMCALIHHANLFSSVCGRRRGRGGRGGGVEL